MCAALEQGHDDPRRRLSSRFDRNAANTTDLQLMPLPAGDRNEEQRELLELPHPLPLSRVVAARAGPGLPGAEVLPLGSETEDEEHQPSVEGRLPNHRSRATAIAGKLPSDRDRASSGHRRRPGAREMVGRPGTVPAATSARSSGPTTVMGIFPGRVPFPECCAPTPRVRTHRLIRYTGVLPPSRRR